MSSFVPPYDDTWPLPRDTWVPRLRTGYFYINDRQYYLYSEKKTKTIRDATRLIFELAEVPIPGTTEVKVEGVPYTNYVVEGNVLVIKLDDEESFAALWSAIEDDVLQWDFVVHGFGFGPSNEVTITYHFLEWVESTTAPDPTGNVFSTLEVTETFKIKNADRVEYQLTKQDGLAIENVVEPSGFLCDPPVDAAPVVITDDLMTYTDGRGFQTEFFVDTLTGEITFNANRNYLQNASFEVTATGTQYNPATFERALEWEFHDPTGIIVGTGDPYHGNNYYQILSPTGQIIQRVEIDPLEPYTVSAYVTGGTAELCVNFINATGEYLDLAGNTSGTLQPSYTLCNYSTTGGSSSSWERLSLTFADPTNNTCAPTGDFISIPADAAEMEIKLQPFSGSTPCVDAVQLEKDYEPTQFVYLDPLSTIEYETSRSGFWLPDPSGQIPFEIQDLDINPVNNPTPGGFLYAEEFSNIDDYQMGLGELSETAVIAPTGVVDPSGSVDLEFGRQFLPYAKTSGFTKFRQRATFHNTNPAPVFDISDLTVANSGSEPIPNDIEIVVDEGLQLVGSETRLVVVPDGRIKVQIDFYVVDQYGNPGFVWRPSVNVTNGQFVFYNDHTSHAGQFSFDYYPPTHAGPGDVGKIDEIRVQVGDVVEFLPVYGFMPSGLDLEKFLGND